MDTTIDKLIISCSKFSSPSKSLADCWDFFLFSAGRGRVETTGVGTEVGVGAERGEFMAAALRFMALLGLMEGSWLDESSDPVRVEVDKFRKHFSNNVEYMKNIV